MIYLTVFWVLFLVFIILRVSSSLFKLGGLKKMLEDFGMPFFIVLLTFAIIAIVTNDPISIFGITVPMELQWLASLFVALFGSWQFYLRPLKNKVYEVDREVGEVRSKIDSIDADVKLIKDKLIRR